MWSSSMMRLHHLHYLLSYTLMCTAVLTTEFILTQIIIYTCLHRSVPFNYRENIVGQFFHSHTQNIPCNILFSLSKDFDIA